MRPDDTVIAVFGDHLLAETAIRKLAAAGFEMKTLSIIGKGYHTEEQVVGFYNIDDRIRFWGLRGAYWGGLWALFFGGVFLTGPLTGPLVVLGYLGAAAIAVIEGTVVVGGLSAIGAALFSIGIPKDSVLEYETAIKADGFLVMAHGSAGQIARAKAILAAVEPERLDHHVGAEEAAPVIHLGRAGAQVVLPSPH